MQLSILIGVLVLLLLVLSARRGFNIVARITVFEYEKGIRYTRGKLDGVIERGVYWYLPMNTTIVKVDERPRFVAVAGQEVLSSDGVTLKVSIAANYEITDPITAINKNQDYQQALYLELQMALREIIGKKTIDEVTEGREDISKLLLEKSLKKVGNLGLKLTSVDIKDIMFPGALKQLFAQVVNARKEGQAALEKARGESAALRNLLNASKMLEDNPNLLQLRLIQAINQSSGNTIVFGVPGNMGTIPVKGKISSQMPDDESSKGSASS
jgi:regulator of protease activity HflC (stomatin/prohibitin superfamily)